MPAARIHSHVHEASREHSIYVLLTDTGTLFTKLIKGFTGAPYNHASIALDAGLNELYSFGRKTANNPLVAGFVREDVYTGTFAHYPATSCALLRLEATPEQRQAVKEVISRFQQSSENYHYHLLGLLGFLLKRPIESDHAYFCSQFVADTLRQSGFVLWDRSPALISPDDFLRHGSVEILYEGDLYDYPLLDEFRLRQANIYQTRTVARYVS
jgi:hypothetical protein